MIDAGLLTDDTGEKLTDLSQLTFAEDLSAMFDQLILKLDDLIGAITGVGDATNNFPSRPPWADWPDPKWPDPNNTDPNIPDPNTYAGGGRVAYAAGGFVPRGSDTVPAMLTPGERVLSVAQNREYERGRGGGTVIVKIGPRTLAEILVPEIPGVVQEYGLGGQ
jgi:hypothetical protein